MSLMTMIRPLQDDDYDALACFRYAMRKFLSFSKQALATEARLTPEQYEAVHNMLDEESKRIEGARVEDVAISS